MLKGSRSFYTLYTVSAKNADFQNKQLLIHYSVLETCKLSLLNAELLETILHSYSVKRKKIQVKIYRSIFFKKLFFGTKIRAHLIH